MIVHWLSRLQQRSSQCIAYDFGLEDDAQVIGNYTSSENINEGMCVVKPTNPMLTVNIFLQGLLKVRSEMVFVRKILVG